MANSKQSIIQVIKDYIANCDGSYPSWNKWYVGITSDPRNRLFKDHRVDENKGGWIHDTAENSFIAREVETYFVNSLGTDGGPGGGDHTTRFVYAYRKTSYTVEEA